ncbi:MAG: MBL fold metallo-hydrolase [Allorhizobium sp.]
MPKSKNPYYTGPVSDHFDGARFFNPSGIPPGGFVEALKWQLNGKRARWPESFTSPFADNRPEPKITGTDLRVTMVGHATLLIQVAGLNILTDPVWSDRASPVAFAGPKRVVAPGIALEMLPPIDVILVTHNHYDHLDLKTLVRLQRSHAPRIFTPLGNENIIRRAAPDAKITVVDWGDRAALSDDIAIDAEPSHHWSARGVRDRCQALWAAFVITTPAGKIYHVGDTGFHDGINYRAAAEKHKNFRLAILPFGAYEPRWFMKGQHQNPDEAVRGMQLCNAAHVAGHHFGTFQLTDEPIGEPVEHLPLDAHGIGRGKFRPLLPGEVFDVPAS